MARRDRQADAKKTEEKGLYKSKGTVRSKTSHRRLTADHHSHRAVSRARILGSGHDSIVASAHLGRPWAF